MKRREASEEKGAVATSEPQSVEGCLDFVVFLLPLDWMKGGDSHVVFDGPVLENASSFPGWRMWCEFSLADRSPDYGLEMILYRGEEHRPPRDREERDRTVRGRIERGNWPACIKLQLTEAEVSRLGSGELFDLELQEGLRVQAGVGRTCSVTTLLVEVVFYSPERVGAAR